MKMTKLVAPAMIGLILFLASCKKFASPEFKGIKNLEVSEFSLKEPTFNLELDYFNPNKAGISIKNADGDAWADGQYLGHFTMDTTVRISGQSNFSLPVRFRADMKMLLKNSWATLLGKDAELKIEGKAKVGKGRIFISYPIRYTGMHNLSEFFSHR
jgi:LEA14-like dessication related protein